MKKIASVLAMLMMVLTLSFTFSSCGGTATVEEEVAALNKECPIKIDDEAKISSVVTERGDAVVTMETNAFPSDVLMRDDINDELKDFARFDAHLVDLLKAEKKNLILRVVCEDGTVDITFKPDQL